MPILTGKQEYSKEKDLYHLRGHYNIFIKTKGKMCEKCEIMAIPNDCDVV